MNGIDEETGLAALPEGLHWEIVKDTFKYKENHIYRMKIIEAVPRSVWRLTWFAKPYRKTVYWNRELFVAPVWDRSHGYGVEYAARLSPGILRDASFETLEDYHEELDKKARIASIEDNSAQYLGDYPPKSIN